MIALFLVSIILTVIFKFYTQLPFALTKIEEAKKSSYPQLQTQTQLSSIFSKIIPLENLPSTIKKKYTPLITTTFADSSLPGVVCIFDNGIDLDPQFSGPVIAKIFIDEKNQFSLAIWPLIEKEDDLPYRKQVLFKEIESFEFSFFDTAPVSKNTAPAKPKWVNSWEHPGRIPSMIRLEIALPDKKKLHFAFFIQSTSDIITYSNPK